MKCPYCGNQEDKVIDSRSIKGGSAIRRRRECLKCGNRFTSYEEIDEVVRMVVKKDGRREPFDRGKIRGGLLKAVEKREIPIDRIESIVHDIEAEVFRDRAEVPTRDIGELLMRVLHELDEVAYVRFASVYRQFSDITEFMTELKTMLGKPEKPGEPPESVPKPRKNNNE